MSKYRLALTVVVSLVLALTTAEPQFGQDAPGSERRALIIGFLRTINAAEAGEYSAHSSYASWQALQAHESEYLNGWLAEYGPRLAQTHFGDLPGVLPGVNLRLTAHQDGRGYDVRVEDANDKEGYAAISDEHGLIWQCKPLQ